MIQDPPQPYQDLETFRASLKIEETDDEVDLILMSYLLAGRRAIDDYTSRSFTVSEDQTLILDIPEGSLIFVPDVLEITSITLYGSSSPLLSSYYHLTKKLGRESGNQIRSLDSNGFPIDWNTDHELESPYGQFQLIGDLGYARSIPEAVILINEALAHRMWTQRMQMFRAGGGSSRTRSAEQVSADLDEDMKNRLASLVLYPVQQVPA